MKKNNLKLKKSNLLKMTLELGLILLQTKKSNLS
jgi:hypothetical protein